MQSKNTYYKFSGLYFFFYYGLGAILPLFALYLESIGLTGTQIGSITAAGSLIGIFSGPFFAYLSDRNKAHKPILMFLMIGVLITSAIVTQVTNYALLFVILIFYYLFMHPINPLMDGITLHSSLPFGKIRLWGSVGFAIAAFVTSIIADKTSLVIPFYILIVTLLLSLVIIQKTQIKITDKNGVDLHQLMTLLSNKKFLVFVTYGMLISSTIGGMNNYFGLYFKSLGGNVSLVGLAFLLFALSEVPFMQILGKYLLRHGPYKMLMVVPILGIIRWGFYSFGPSPLLILLTFPIQGLFYAPILIGSAEYIRLEFPSNLRTTGIALYTSLGFGLGGIIANSLSGYLYEHYSANTIFMAYTLLCTLALFFTPSIYRSRTHNR